jgi:hypothetical protein
MSISPEPVYVARWFEDERKAWARRPRVRRRAVIAEATLVAALITATVVAAASDRGWPTWFLIAWMVGMFSFIPLHSVLNLGIRGVLHRDRRSLDEHQQRMRDRSFVAVRWPSWALTFGAIIGAVTVLDRTGNVDLALCFGVLLWWAACLLAYWHLAWTAPDEPADD